MVETTFRGPGVVGGSTYDGRIEPMDGPSLDYQGDGIPDIRFWPMKKDGLYPGRIPALLNSPYIVPGLWRRLTVRPRATRRFLRASRFCQ